MKRSNGIVGSCDEKFTGSNLTNVSMIFSFVISDFHYFWRNIYSYEHGINHCISLSWYSYDICLVKFNFFNINYKVNNYSIYFISFLYVNFLYISTTRITFLFHYIHIIITFQSLFHYLISFICTKCHLIMIELIPNIQIMMYFWSSKLVEKIYLLVLL